MEKALLAVRGDHPAWGGRKIRARLQAVGKENVPAPSTITAILKRHGRINPEESPKHKAFKRFEADAPNDLWQMDFKGHFDAAEGRCHPLTVLDDHSRYSVGLKACGNEKAQTVRQCLAEIFRRYGLPKKILTDNGSPWGSDKDHPHTPLTVWMMRLGVVVIHARAYHPQTLGKDERFHQTLKKEVSQYCIGLNLRRCQKRFDQWRDIYNFQRPHESLDMAVPASRYRQSTRSYPENLPPIQYGPGDQIRKVQYGGWISFRNRPYRISRAFRGEYVALRPTATDGLFDIFFCNQKIDQINLKHHN
jgi:transposase InsO family protein